MDAAEWLEHLVAIELEDMPSLNVGAQGLFSSASSPSLLYSLRFDVGVTSYEVRAYFLLGGTFGLFDCTNKARAICTKVADLGGGYGTTGERVVFSLPLHAIGLDNGGELADVVAFSGLGSQLTRASKIMDTVNLK